MLLCSGVPIKVPPEATQFSVCSGPSGIKNVSLHLTSWGCATVGADISFSVLLLIVTSITAEQSRAMPSLVVSKQMQNHHKIVLCSFFTFEKSFKIRVLQYTNNFYAPYQKKNNVFNKEHTWTKINSSAFVVSNNLETVAMCYYLPNCNPCFYVKCLSEDC